LISLLVTGCSASQQIATDGAHQAGPTETAAVAATMTEVTTVIETATATVPTTAPPTGTPTATEMTIAIEDVIAFEMRGSFDFFWEQANTDTASPGFGLIRDRYPGSEGVASIASVGFGLTAYLVGIEKGYISQEAGYARVNQTLDTLLAMERVEGFFYHFVNMQTAKRAWKSEVSTIDTSLLLMGVLSAGEYFGGEIEVKAQQLYDEVNWPWFVDEEQQMFYMAYRPESGFEGHWDFYAEQLILYVLAAGSDTHPVDDATYYGFTRHFAKYGEGQPFIHSWFGSIFTYQFSHAWIDFRGYVDQQGVNWFDNSVEASLAQVNFATTMAPKYKTLGPTAWGLTASDGPQGYNGLYGAPPSGYDNRAHLVDDTIAPSGAIGSIVFLPEQAQAAMLNYYSQAALKGPYGFLDAYNLSENWYASDVIGIDKGITLLMLANYENDLVYGIVMKNAHILNGLQRLQMTKSE
jgi:hypothetical protein